MRAVRYTTFGPAADVLHTVDLPIPSPERGDVLVRVTASGINPHDTKKRSGWLGGAMPEQGVVPHSDGAGRIVGVGADVSASRMGQRVMVFGAGTGRHGGTAAEHVVVPCHQAIALPAGVSDTAAAALGIPAITAYTCILSEGSVAGRAVLVHAGAGAVGRNAVEMAAWNGATVIATVSSEAKAEIARAAGAHHVLNYRTDNVAEAVMRITGGRGADIIADVDFGANVAVDAACLAAHGRIASYSATSNRTPVLPYYDFAAKGARLHFVQTMTIPPAMAAEACRTIVAMLGQGRLSPRIAAVLPLEEAARAHELLESGTTAGNIILQVADGAS